jgi:hypothetical protein
MHMRSPHTVSDGAHQRRRAEAAVPVQTISSRLTWLASAELSEEPVFLRVIDDLDRDVFRTNAWILTEKLNSAFEERLLLVGVTRICGGQLNEYEIARPLNPGVVLFEERIAILHLGDDVEFAACRNVVRLDHCAMTPSETTRRKFSGLSPLKNI